MGGKGSGGTRSGTPGRAYSNRTDLNTRKLPISTARNQPYGVAGQQRASQSVVPLGTPTAPVPSPGMQSPSTPASRSSIPLSAPSARPDEPVTSGLSIGAGPGPETLFAPITDATSLELRALYQLYPNNDILDLIEFMDRGETY